MFDGKYKVLFWIVVGLGALLGSLWGLPPGYLFDMGLKPPDPGKSGGPVWFFILFATFYGYLSIVLLLFWLVAGGFWEPLRRHLVKKKILAGYFGNGERKVGYETFRKLTGVTPEEMVRLYGPRKSDFGYTDYLTAGVYLKSLGIAVEKRLPPENQDLRPR